MKGGLLKRFNRFRKAIDFLEQLSEKDPEEVIRDYVLLSSLERNIQVAVEFVVDAANYLLSELSGEIPDTYKEIIERAGNICGIDEELVAETRGVVGLRNIIVHLYADIDYELVLGELKNIVDTLSRYVLEIIRCMERKGLDP